MSKVHWTNLTWNPVWGCEANCEYCYARKMAKRFAYIIAEKETAIRTYTDIPTPMELERNRLAYKIEDFTPVFLKSHFNKKFPKKPCRIFVGSMSDIAFWKDKWIKMVVDKIKQYPQHTFLLLSKFPNRYFDSLFWKIPEIPKNIICGVTIDNEQQNEKVYDFFDTKAAIECQANELIFKTFIFFEPLLLNKVSQKCESNIKDTDWITIGTMSGQKRTPANIDIVKEIVLIAKKYNKPVFIKQLEINGKVHRDITKFPKDLQLREFPI